MMETRQINSDNATLTQAGRRSLRGETASLGEVGGSG